MGMIDDSRKLPKTYLDSVGRAVGGPCVDTKNIMSQPHNEHREEENILFRLARHETLDVGILVSSPRKANFSITAFLKPFKFSPVHRSLDDLIFWDIVVLEALGEIFRVTVPGFAFAVVPIISNTSGLPMVIPRDMDGVLRADTESVDSDG